jgi:hypothetical protein
MEADQTVAKQLPAQSADVPSLNRHAVPTDSTEVMTQAPSAIRVTAPSPTARTKDPKKQAAGRAGAAARKAKQERLLEELRAAKEAIAPAATPVADRAPKEQPVADVLSQQPMPASANPGDSVEANWTPWILVGAGLAALCVTYMSRSPLVKPTVSGADTKCRQKQQHPEARSSGASQPDGTSTTPRGAQHLKVTNDPFYMA